MSGVYGAVGIAGSNSAESKSYFLTVHNIDTGEDCKICMDERECMLKMSK
jgi:hypothetical protein